MSNELALNRCALRDWLTQVLAVLCAQCAWTNLTKLPESGYNHIATFLPGAANRKKNNPLKSRKSHQRIRRI